MWKKAAKNKNKSGKLEKLKYKNAKIKIKNN